MVNWEGEGRVEDSVEGIEVFEAVGDVIIELVAAGLNIWVHAGHVVVEGVAWAEFVVIVVSRGAVGAVFDG